MEVIEPAGPSERQQDVLICHSLHEKDGLIQVQCGQAEFFSEIDLKPVA